MASLDNFLNKCLYLAEMPDRYGKTSSELIEIKNSINEFDQLQSTITAQEDIIKRMSSLAKDAIELLDCDTENSAVEKAIEDTKYEFTSLMKELVEKGIEVVG